MSGETTTPGLDGDDVTKRIQITGRVDDLRSRIAAVVYRHTLFRALDQCECGAAFDGFSGRSLDAYAVHVADAVIRELGLEREDGECGYCHAQLPGCRYVTDWTANE